MQLINLPILTVQDNTVNLAQHRTVYRIRRFIIA